MLTLILATMLTATCTDGAKNQDEQFTDCGGATCGPCVLYVVDKGWSQLSEAQQLYLTNAIESGLFGIDAANVDRYACGANRPAPADKHAIDLAAYKDSSRWMCQATELAPTVTDDEAFAMEMDEPTAVNPLSCKIKEGSPPRKECTRYMMTSDGRVNNKAFAEDAFGLDIIWLYNFICQPKEDGSPCRHLVYKIASSKTWRADRRAQTSTGTPRVPGGPIGKLANP